MTAIAAATTSAPTSAATRVKLDQPVDIRALLVFLAILAGGLFFMAYSIYSDIEETNAAPTTNSGVRAYTSCFSRQPFFHQISSIITAGREQATVLLSRAHTKRNRPNR